MPATCSSAADKTATIGKRNARRPSEGGTPRQRNIFRIISLFIAATKICPISRAMSKSRDIASQARTSIALEGSSISLVCSLPRCRIDMANLAEGAARAVGRDTSFCCRTCAMPTDPGAGIVLPPSAVCREPLDKLIRRKLMPSLEHVTRREPTVTPSRLAISSRLIPSATNFLIFSITSPVNLTRRPLTGGLACGVVMAAPLSPRVHDLRLFSDTLCKIETAHLVLLESVAILHDFPKGTDPPPL